MGAEVVAPRPPSSAGKRRSTTLRFLFELEKPDGLLPGTAKLPPPSPEPESDSLIDKIASCHRVFTFSCAGAGESEEERDAKRDRLVEVLGAVRSAGGCCSKPKPLDHRVMVALLKMVAANLFRAMPPSAYPPLPPDGVDDDAAPAAALAPAWPHLQVVYDILLSVVTSADAKTLRNHVDRAFLSGLLALFRSEDPRERDRLKTAYHQLYAKLTGERASMRRAMAAALLRFAYEAPPGERPCGAAELLEICGSIINGFAVPLKEEHRAFLARVLLPLHRTRWAHTYHRQLAYCVLQFVRKEPGLAGGVVTGILRHWPVTNCQKEVLLIEELEEILEVLEPMQFEKLAVPVCARIARCVSSCSSQVAERALYVWNNERFLELATSSPGVMEKILPAFVASVEGNLEGHWSKCVQQVAASVKALLEQVAPDLYARCAADLAARRAEAEAAAAVRDARWRKLEDAAAAK
ncbi:unnamed protein product [Urochloa humidicola]